MMKRGQSGLALAILLLNGTAAFCAEAPTVHQVYEAAQSGRLNEAQGMIQQVLKEHPNSAKAHYVDADLLAMAGHAAEARGELNTAEQLEPGLPFISPQSVQKLKAEIAGMPKGPESGSAIAIQGAQSQFPWRWVFLGVGLFAVIAIIMRLMARQNAAQTAYPMYHQSGVAPGGGYMPGSQTTPGLGSNIISGLATGAALGAGMVAGEELVRHFTDGNANTASTNQSTTDTWGSDTDKLGGTDFGMADNSSWDDGSNNMADMSSGDDWS